MKIGNLEVYGIIYKIENLINGKVYIGQTIQGFRRRYHANGGYTDEERFYNQIMKTNSNSGSLNFLKEDLKNISYKELNVNSCIDYAFSKEELNIKEKVWISLSNSTNREKGYNISNGGYSYSGIYTSKNRDKNGELIKKSVPKSEKTQEELEEWYNNIAKARKDKSMIKIVCLTTNEVFEGMKYALIKYPKIDASNLTKCCKGKKESAGKLPDKTKLKWKYLKDLTDEEKNKIFNNRINN